MKDTGKGQKGSKSKRANPTDHKEEVKKVGQGQGGQSK